MTINTDVDLGKAFAGHKSAPEQVPTVPEAIKRHAPIPELRPGGSWRARADAVDRAVHEADEAAKARQSWADRASTGQKQGMGSAFRKNARGF